MMRKTFLPLSLGAMALSFMGHGFANERPLYKEWRLDTLRVSSGEQVDVLEAMGIDQPLEGCDVSVGFGASQLGSEKSLIHIELELPNENRSYTLTPRSVQLMGGRFVASEMDGAYALVTTDSELTLKDLGVAVRCGTLESQKIDLGLIFDEGDKLDLSSKADLDKLSGCVLDFMFFEGQLAQLVNEPVLLPALELSVDNLPHGTVFLKDQFSIQRPKCTSQKECREWNRKPLLSEAQPVMEFSAMRNIILDAVTIKTICPFD